jgi:hypothetical protein
LIGCVVLASTPSSAQWWPFGPRDYEDCAARAEASATAKDVRATLLNECDAKFAGRRKPGGGYTYYDFMQNRHFDIAGPNPTAEELKKFDEEYTAYLERQRHNAIAAALAEKQRQLAQAEQQTAVSKEPATTASVAPITGKASTALKTQQSRHKTEQCQHRLECTWADLSARVKSLLGLTPKPRRHAKT